MKEPIIYEGTKAIRYYDNPNGVVNYLKPETTIIGKNCFEDRKITTIYIPDNVEIIEEYAFENCKNLTKVSLPKNLKIVKTNAFEKCSLNFFPLPDSLKEIEFAAFSGVKGTVKEFILPKNLEILESFAFEHLKVGKLVIPKNVTQFSSVAFKSVDEFEVDKDNEYYASHNGNLYSKDFKTLIRMGNKSKSILDIEKIGYGSFFNIHLEELSLPESVKIIDEKAFIDAKIKTIIIPKSVEQIHLDAFHFLKSENIISNNINLLTEDGAVYLNDSYKTLIYYSSLRNNESMKIADSCVLINDYAFANSKLQKIETGRGERLSIGMDAFDGCKRLTKLLLRRPVSININDVVSETNIRDFVLPNGSEIAAKITKKCNVMLSDKDYETFKYYFDGSANAQKQKNLDELLNEGKSLKEINDILKNYER